MTVQPECYSCGSKSQTIKYKGKELCKECFENKHIINHRMIQE